MSVTLCGAGKDIYTEAVGCKAQNIERRGKGWKVKPERAGNKRAVRRN